MDAIALYQSKLTTPEHAVATIPSGSRLSMGMFDSRTAGAFEGAR
jgi:itaconate CoA-transferase